MENPARPQCRSWSSQPWLGFWKRRPGSPLWHVAVLSGVPAATFQPGIFPTACCSGTRGEDVLCRGAVPRGCAAGTQRSSQL